MAILAAVALLLPLTALGAAWAAKPAAAVVVDGVDWGDIDPAGSPRISDAPPDFFLPIYMNYVLPELAVAASEVSDPNSVYYGDYLDLPTALERYGASPEDQQAVNDALADAGASPQDIGASYTFARTPMTVAAAEKFFGVTFGIYQASPTVDAIAPDAQPSLPATLDGVIDAVIGLVVPVQAQATGVEGGPIVNPLQAPAPAPKLPTPGTLATPVRTGVAEGCEEALAKGGFTPNQLATAYGYDVLHEQGLKGQGQRLAVLELGANVAESDITTFNECFGLEGVTELRQVNVGGAASMDSENVGEATLDVQVVAQVAPQLEAFELYSFNDLSVGLSAFLETLVMPLDPEVYGPAGPVDIVSVSYGTCELQFAGATPLLAMTEQVMAMAATIGMSYFIATGDDGSATCFRLSPQLTQLTTSYPATSQWATAVGGTGLSLSGPPFTPQLPPNIVLDDPQTGVRFESAWNDTLFPGMTFLEAGGGGGTSELLPRPAWQSGPGVPEGEARLVPDIAMFADVFPGWTVYCTPAGCGPSGWQTVGGTSAATPQAAAIAALLNQAIDEGPPEAGRPNVGFFNPALYDLVNRQYEPGKFKVPYAVRDVSTANNDITGAGCCSATVAYDLASGWGSLHGSSLVEAWLATPGRPEINGYMSGYAMVTLTVAAPVSESTITGYEYSTDFGATWVTAEIAGDPAAPTVKVPVMGIPPGGNVKVSVRAVNEVGPGLPSELFTVRADGAGYEALAESERVLDTRTGGGPVAPGTPLVVDVAAPDGAVAVAYNVTVTGTTGSGYAVVYPAGDERPGSSTINWTGPNQTLANSFVSGISEAGEVTVEVVGTPTQVVLDVQGYYLPLPEPKPNGVKGAGEAGAGADGGEGAVGAAEAGAAGSAGPAGAADASAAAGSAGEPGVGAAGAAAEVAAAGAADASAAAGVAGTSVQAANGAPPLGGLVPITPMRAYDSRANGGAVSGGGSVTVPLDEFVPEGTTAVAYTLTETGTQGTGYLSVGLPGGPVPTTSVLNWTGPNVTMANSSTAAVDSQRALEVIVGGGGSTQVVVDVIGYFVPFMEEPEALAFAAIDPERSYDSREEGGPLAGGKSRVSAVGVPGVPFDAPAVAVNLTVTGTVGSGFLSLAPGDAAQRPEASSINWMRSGTTIANGTVVDTADDTIRTFAGGGGSTQYLTDIAGYYSYLPVG